MKKTFSTRFWVIVLSCALMVFAALALYVGRGSGGHTLARITVDGKVWREIDLTAVTGETGLDVVTDRGTNHILLRPGGIRVSFADCPDQICVDQGWLSGGRIPIVCLPHRLVIELVEGGDDDSFDAVSGR